MPKRNLIGSAAFLRPSLPSSGFKSRWMGQTVCYIISVNPLRYCVSSFGFTLIETNALGGDWSLVLFWSAAAWTKTSISSCPSCAKTFKQGNMLVYLVFMLRLALVLKQDLPERELCSPSWDPEKESMETITEALCEDLSSNYIKFELGLSRSNRFFSIRPIDRN